MKFEKKISLMFPHKLASHEKAIQKIMPINKAGNMSRGQCLHLISVHNVEYWRTQKSGKKSVHV